MNKYLIFLLDVVAVALGVFIGVHLFSPAQRLGDSTPGAHLLSATVSSTTITNVGTHPSGHQVFLADSSRQYADICSAATSSAVYLNFATSTQGWATKTAGVRLAAGACYEIDNHNLWVGNVTAIADTNTTTLTFTTSP